MDLGLAFAMGLLILPFVVLIALAIKLTSPGPVFYGQTRIGRGRRTFRAWKFRTMRVDADEVLAKVLAEDDDLREEWERTHKLRKDPRVTGIGQILRKTSLDELPQIWNVFRGDMSLVGPRPVVEAEAAKYDEGFGPYLCVRPGITGLWQVSGRNRTTYAERVRLDEYYVDNWSPWLDLNILARTVHAVLTGDGAC
jgi:Undecaprenyl-phosphate galactose phosphotransferase WbaP